MSGHDLEIEEVELPFAVASLDPTVQSADEVARDGGVLIMPAAGIDTPPQFIPQAVLDADAMMLKELASVALNFVPGVSNVKNLIEGISGEDLVTGEHKEAWERVLSIAAALPIPEVEGEWAIINFGKMINTAHEIHELAEEVHHAEQVVHTIEVLREPGEVMERTGEVYRSGEGEGGGEAGGGEH